ncbi:hypothetical protein Leryth_014716 [Lithospermum erythrorhizon]|nr:hypothetical protein Leryth_014716 [Lithospermum erythrorhizon]
MIILIFFLLNPFSSKLQAKFEPFLRCGEKHNKEASQLQALNRKLRAMDKLPMEEDDRLQKQVSHLVLLSIAEETVTEILSKVTGTAVEWVQMPGMKHSRFNGMHCYFYVVLIWRMAIVLWPRWFKSQRVLRALSQRLSRGGSEWF